MTRKAIEAFGRAARRLDAAGTKAPVRVSGCAKEIKDISGMTNPTSLTVEQRRMGLINVIIDAYHTTRLSEVPVTTHILSRAYVKEAFARFEADHLTSTDRLRDALEALESANEALCAKRSQETYLRMIDVDHCQDELIRLDEARRQAREALTSTPAASVDEARSELVKQGAIGLARFHHPDAEMEPTGQMPLWFSYLGEANAVLTAALRTTPAPSGEREA